MEMRIKYVKKNNVWCYAVQVKRWLFWRTIFMDSSFNNTQKFIDTLDKIDDFNSKTKSLNKIVCDGWVVKNVYKDTGPNCMINFYQSYPIREENSNHAVIYWTDGNGTIIPAIQIKTERLFGKECIEPMKVRITIE